MSKLTLGYEYDASFFDPKLPRDDFGRLSLSVTTGQFSGAGGFWVQWQDVREFCDALSAYPIRDGSPIIAQWGFGMQEGDDLILRLEIAPADKRGNLSIRFEVADDFVPRNRVRGSFLTNYPEIETFRVSIARLMNHEADEAVLIGQ
ncbi:hypothetical protein [Sphingomonas sp. MMS24-J13]|uniref:hypothetical protein n=1 Tax=Sphingomonas sp. MMS24-J13 TaxID=3238686 RepID=UPI00384C56D4